MAGQSSPQTKGFRPLDLMEGFSSPEVFKRIAEIDALLDGAFGPEKEIRVVALSFLIGNYLQSSQVTQAQAFAMIHAASRIGTS